MEYEVLKLLNFNLVFPTSNDFFNIIAKLFEFNEIQFCLGKYILDSSLLDYQMIKYSSSITAVASAYLVMKSFGISGYKSLYSNILIKEESPQKKIKIVAQELYELMKNLSDCKLKAVKNKYSLPMFYNISDIFEQFLKQRI